MAAKLVTGIAKVTQKILKAHKGKTLGKLSRVSSGFGRTATKLAKYNMIGKGIEAIANRNNNKADTSLPALSDYDAVAASMAENNTADPIIGIPDLNIEEIIRPTAERVDLTVIEPVMGEVTVDPTSVVESYFDGDAAPITTDAIIPAGVEIQGISNSVGAIASQIEALEGLKNAVDEAIDQNADTKRKNERRRDEEDIEKKKPRDGVFQMGERAGDIAGGFLAKWLVPAAAAAFAGIANAFADDQEDNTTTVGDMLDELSWLEGIEEKYAALTLALGTAGFNVSKGFKDLSKGISAKSATFVQKMSAVSGKAMDAYQKTANNLAKLSKVLTTNPVASAFIAPIRMLAGFFGGIAKTLGGAIANITKAVAKLPMFIVKFLKGFAAKPLKYLLIFEIIDSMIDALMAFMFNSITEEEFHTRTKKNINDMVGLIGGTWITTIIFTAVGTAIGSVVPIFGNLAGMTLGVVMGVLFGEDVYKIIGGDDIVEAIYDYWFLGKKTTMSDLANKILETGKKQLQSVVDQYVEFFKSTFEYFSGEDKIATVEGIEEKYGADASLADIAIQSKGLLDDDENALLYVADSIDSPEELEEINAAMIEREGKTLREHAQGILSPSEYQKFNQILDASIAEGAPPPPSIEYPVTNYDGETIGTFSTPEEAAQFAMQNQGIMQTAIITPVAELVADVVDLDNEVVETVNKIQRVFSSDDPEEKLTGLYDAAIDVSTKGNYEEVTALYEETTGRRMVDDLGDIINEENATLIDNMMRATPEELPALAADAGIDMVIEKYMPEVASEIKDKAEQIIPVISNIVQQAQRAGEIAAGSQPASRVDYASPTFDSSDNFLQRSLQT